MLLCGVKSDDDFLRVHEKEGQKAAKKERENKRTTEQRKEKGENFLRFKRELTVGIDQTTNVFFHPQTKENKRVLYLSTLSKRDLL